MKRYLAFYGDQYYPQGGWDDLLGSFDTKEEALYSLEEADSKNGNPPSDKWVCAWAHIVDSTTGDYVWDDDRGYVTNESE